MSRVVVTHNKLHMGERFSVSFQRTLRIPQDGQIYPLPPGMGAFPIHDVEDYLDRVPAAWREYGGVFIPMYQREALWFGFGGAYWKPNAVKIAIGKINAISGEAWNRRLREDPQDYIVCPDQPWLDGINSGDRFVRQFIAMPLGLGYTVEAQVGETEEFGGIQIVVYEPRSGRFPDRPPPERDSGIDALSAPAMNAAGEMGLGAGGRIKQKIYPDPYGIDAWDKENYSCAFVYIVNSERYQELTGFEPPPTPISARTYIKYGLPWFDLYDETRADVAAPVKLAKVKAIRDVDNGSAATEEEASVDATKFPIENLHPQVPTRNTRDRSAYKSQGGDTRD